MTIAAMVQREIDKKGWTQADAAIKLGVSRLTVSQLVNHKRGVTATMALRLERAFGVKALVWLRAQADAELAAAKRDARVRVAR
jgi:addiction module HigA family antidote